jgi:hypothetical protein
MRVWRTFVIVYLNDEGEEDQYGIARFEEESDQEFPEVVLEAYERLHGTRTMYPGNIHVMESRPVPALSVQIRPYANTSGPRDKIYDEYMYRVILSDHEDNELRISASYSLDEALDIARRSVGWVKNIERGLMLWDKHGF